MRINALDETKYNKMNDHDRLWKEMNNSKKEYIKKFRDRKFGMFIHFGVYSMLAGEWEGKRIEEGRRPFVAEWIMHAMKIKRDEYKKVAKEFNPKKFCAKAVVDLAKKANMKYIVITSKHHDGFALYKSKVSDFNIYDFTKYKKDLIKELYDECKKEGLEFGLYYSHSIDWMDGGDGGMRDYFNDNNALLGLHAYNEYDPHKRSYDEYIKEKAIPQVKEILNMFPKLSNIWFDVPYYIPEKYSFEFYKTVYEIQPQILVSQRVGNEYGDIACPGDNKIPKEKSEYEGVWEGIGTMNNSWGYKHYDHDWKYPKEVLYWLVEIISKGGNYMLNIGPDGDGNIPKENVEILTKVGEWIDKNKDAIFNTRPYAISYEGEMLTDMEGTAAREKSGFNLEFTKDDVWFTSKDREIFCIYLFSGKVKELFIKSLKGIDIKEISILGENISISYEQEEDGIKVILSKEFDSKMGFSLKVTY